MHATCDQPHTKLLQLHHVPAADRGQCEVMHRSISSVHEANICMCLRRGMKCDPVKEKFVGDPEVNRLHSRPLRAPCIIQQLHWQKGSNMKSKPLLSFVLSLLLSATALAADTTPPPTPLSTLPEGELIQILNSDASEKEKDDACRQLAVVGSQAAVPALARLLADER